MNFNKRTFQLIFLFFYTVIYSQSNKEDTLLGDFTYLLKTKINRASPNQINDEIFSLQITDNRSFFINNKSLKRDSILEIISKNAENNGNIYDFRGKSIPETKFPYTIIQSTENIHYFQRVGMSLFMYKEPIIRNWKLSNESKTINTINCKKAEINYKGRNWIAWYSTEIPLPYGPYKFSGLPGLIIKITDNKNDYDFELVKATSSSELKSKLISINKNRYTEAIETTQQKLEQALEDARENANFILQNYETTIIQGKEIVEQRLKERQLNSKNENPIEIK